MGIMNPPFSFNKIGSFNNYLNLLSLFTTFVNHFLYDLSKKNFKTVELYVSIMFIYDLVVYIRRYIQYISVRHLDHL